MKPSDFQKTVQCRFESCLKKVVRHVVKDYQKKLKRRQKEETLFCELPEIVVENLAVWDDYDTDYTIFNVCGNDIRVYDDELAEALKQLSERNRETLLMYYFLEMNNEEIAKKQNISRNLNPAYGCEHGGIRPVLILQNDVGKNGWGPMSAAPILHAVTNTVQSIIYDRMF